MNWMTKPLKFSVILALVAVVSGTGDNSTASDDDEGSAGIEWCGWPGYYTDPDKEPLFPGEDSYMCVSCPLGTYSLGGYITECIVCPNGTTTHYTTSGNPRLCTKCEMGYLEVDGDCQPCPKGTYFYRPSIRSEYKCSQCFGYYGGGPVTTAGEASTSRNDCGCDIGHRYEPRSYYLKEGCYECRQDWYKDTVGSVNCKECPSEVYTTLATGATECVCEAGYFMYEPAKRCVKCGIGYYSPIGATNCTECPANRTTSEEGRTLVSDCVCEAGMFEDPFTKECVLCYDGTYRNNLDAMTCSQCPRGQTSSHPYTDCVEE